MVSRNAVGAVYAAGPAEQALGKDFLKPAGRREGLLPPGPDECHFSSRREGLSAGFAIHRAYCEAGPAIVAGWEILRDGIIPNGRAISHSGSKGGSRKDFSRIENPLRIKEVFYFFHETGLKRVQLHGKIS